MGIVDSICIQYRYQEEKAGNALEPFFTHRDNKEKGQKIHKEYGSNKDMKKFIYDEIWKSDLLSLIGYTDNSIMGIPIQELFSRKEIERKKLELISDLIRHQNKKEA